MANWDYVKGEGRYKHVWGRDEAGFVPSNRGPVGKCPSSIKNPEAKELLNDGIEYDPHLEPDDEIPEDYYPPYIFNVRKGVIFEAAPTNPGESYHAYPWRGFIPDDVLDKLVERATASGDDKVIKRWIKQYRNK